MTGWSVLVVAGLLLAGFFLRRGKPALYEGAVVVTFDDEAIHTAWPDGTFVRVRWDELTRVLIRTTDEGPLVADVFWLFYTGGTDAVMVFPGGATGEQELLQEMQRRLAGFDDEQVIAAMGSTSNELFTVWARPEDRVGGGAHRPRLPSHHRTYGSVSGGSGSAVKLQPSIGERWQPLLTEPFGRERGRHRLQ